MVQSPRGWYQSIELKMASTKAVRYVGFVHKLVYRTMCKIDKTTRKRLRRETGQETKLTDSSSDWHWCQTD
jgi:hypothetical protein